ncbi:MAG: hypothetical protein AAF360_02445 [Pseudomonadota bacterium]
MRPPALDLVSPPTLAPALLSALLIVAAPMLAAAQEDPDWPCAQRKVAHLSWGQMWSGPPLPDDGGWRDDPVIGPLSSRLAARRTSIEDAPALIDAAGLSGADDHATLFAGAFELIDKERARLVEGIGRFARKQQDRAARVDAIRVEINEMRASTAPDDFDGLDRLEAREDELAWETRIYQDRRRSLEFVCESPVTLEKRAFALARMIQERLPE